MTVVRALRYGTNALLKAMPIHVKNLPVLEQLYVGRLALSVGSEGLDGRVLDGPSHTTHHMTLLLLLC